jgi:uncharacterized protein (TIGR02285 family)
MRFLLLTTLLLLSRFSYSIDSINWYVYDRPPSHFLSGPQVNQGYLDKLLTLTIKDLTEYKHNKVKATIARGLREMELGNKACHLSIFKTKKREVFTEFSLAHIMAPNLRVII